MCTQGMCVCPPGLVQVEAQCVANPGQNGKNTIGFHSLVGLLRIHIALRYESYWYLLALFVTFAPILFKLSGTVEIL